MQTSFASRRRASRLARLRPLVLALVAAGYASAWGAPPAIDSKTLPDFSVDKGARFVGSFKVEAPVITESTASQTVQQLSSKGLIEVRQSSANGQTQIQSFSIGSQAQLSILAPDATALTVIRSMGLDPSSIQGRITANDRLFIINPNGIYVGSGASVSAASLLMSALDIDPAYAADDYAKLFSDSHVVFASGGGSGYGSPIVDVDQGARLTATDGGGVMLVGDKGVRNQGAISTGLGGDITLVAGGRVEMDIGDSGFIKLVSATAPNLPGGYADFTGRTVINTGTLDAPNGTISLLTVGNGFSVNIFDSDPTGLSSQLFEGTPTGVFNAGAITAQGVDGGQGKVVMKAEGRNAVVMNSGTVDVSAKDAKSAAGSILLSAQTVAVGNVSDDLALLLAEGPTGGGQITLNNATVTGGETSSLIQVLPSAKLSVDATDSGDGGRITLSSLDGLDIKDIEGGGNFGNLQVYGTLQARGGLKGGNGGQIETSGRVVNVHDADLGQATILVGARAPGWAGGLWSVYSPYLTIGNSIPSSANGLGQSSTYISSQDINAVLDQGGSVGVSTSYQGNNQVASGDLIVETGTQIIQSTGGGGNSLYLQSDNYVVLNSGVTIASKSGKLNVTLAADADQDGYGSVVLDGFRVIDAGGGQVEQVLSAGNKQAQAVRLPLAEGDAPVTITSNGGNVTLVGASQPVAGSDFSNDDAGVVMRGAVIDTRGAASRGDVLVKGAGGLTFFAGEGGGPSQNGVEVTGNTSITAGNVNILGFSQSASGVKLSDTEISTDKGVIDIRGVAQGAFDAPKVGTPIGVDIGSNVVFNAGQGYVRILGRGVREAAGGAVASYGVRANDLTITTSGANSGQQITIVGQSVGSTGAGVQVDAGQPGIQVFDQASQPGAPIASTTDIVIGGSADAAAPLALNLGKPVFFTNGRLNFRPAGVDSSAQLTEGAGNAIRVGSGAGGIPTNFIVQAAWFNPGANSGISPGALTVIGSDIQSGLISVEAGALDGAGTVTLQNQGVGSNGIELGAQTGANPALNLGLATAGDISQSGPINVASLKVIASPESVVTLNDPGNKIATAVFDNDVLAPQINAQALPQSSVSTSALGYSVNADTPENSSFVPLAINFRYSESQVPFVAPEDRPKLPFESVDALNELRTDVYLHGQFSRPQLCTPSNTTGSPSADAASADPLSLEWTKVRRGAQLTNCSGVQAEGSCSAF